MFRRPKTDGCWIYPVLDWCEPVETVWNRYVNTAAVGRESFLSPLWPLSVASFPVPVAWSRMLQVLLVKLDGRISGLVVRQE